MYDTENKKEHITQEKETSQLEPALMYYGLGGWSAIIGVGGTLAFFINMIFRGVGAFIKIGSASFYIWELCLFYFIVIAIALYLPRLKIPNIWPPRKRDRQLGLLAKGSTSGSLFQL